VRYLVTGATGFIGGELARQLAAASFDVVALVRDPERARADERAPSDDQGRATDSPSSILSHPRVVVAKGDITDKESMREAMAGVDGIFHVAGWYHIGARDKSPAFRINVEGTRNVLELAGELTIPRIVYTSTLAVFSDTHGQLVDESYRFAGKHLSVYDLTKSLAHYEVAVPLMQAGLPLVIVQPGAVYGPGDRGPLADVFRLYLRRKLPAIPQRVAYCWGHVSDIARAHILAMQKGRIGEAYIIAGPCHELVEVVKLLEKITSIPPPRTASPAVLRAAAAVMGLVDHIHPLAGSLSPESLRLGGGVTYLGTNVKATKELGIQMRPIEEGLRESLPWYIRSARGR
jgi:nucleoside-diphosphate-sugar epimerase